MHNKNSPLIRHRHVDNLVKNPTLSNPKRANRTHGTAQHSRATNRNFCAEFFFVVVVAARRKVTFVKIDFVNEQSFSKIRLTKKTGLWCATEGNDADDFGEKFRRWKFIDSRRRHLTSNRNSQHRR